MQKLSTVLDGLLVCMCKFGVSTQQELLTNDPSCQHEADTQGAAIPESKGYSGCGWCRVVLVIL